MMVRILACILAACLSISDGTRELTRANFEAEVFDSGKNAFVKFLAPW